MTKSRFVRDSRNIIESIMPGARRSGGRRSSRLKPAGKSRGNRSALHQLKLVANTGRLKPAQNSPAPGRDARTPGVFSDAATAAVLIVICMATWLVAGAPLLADDFDLSWYTVDGGGAMFSAGGDFEVSGTIGQPDAGPASGAMTGGTFELAGGFWVAGAAGICTCPGDLNGDALIDGDDVQAFVDCLLSGGPGCACADMDGAGGVTVSDVALMVDALLNAANCP